jgi:hypothetical protein
MKGVVRSWVVVLGLMVVCAPAMSRPAFASREAAFSETPRQTKHGVAEKVRRFVLDRAPRLSRTGRHLFKPGKLAHLVESKRLRELTLASGMIVALTATVAAAEPGTAAQGEAALGQLVAHLQQHVWPHVAAGSIHVWNHLPQATAYATIGFVSRELLWPVRRAWSASRYALMALGGATTLAAAGAGILTWQGVIPLESWQSGWKTLEAWWQSGAPTETLSTAGGYATDQAKRVADGVQKLANQHPDLAKTIKETVSRQTAMTMRYWRDYPVGAVASILTGRYVLRKLFDRRRRVSKAHKEER